MPTDPTHIDPAHAELLAKAKAATPGPWYAGDGAMYGFDGEWDVFGPDDCGLASMAGTAEVAKYARNKEANADFIAAANPTAIIDLITQLGEARAELARINERHIANIKARDEARNGEQRAAAALLEAQERLDDLRHHLQVPEGAKRLDAWESNGTLIVCGTPPGEDEGIAEDDPNAHNCDAMGCGSCSHVIIRERLDKYGALAARGTAAGEGTKP